MGLMPFDHPNLPLAAIHIPIAFSYADATARLAATGMVPTDVYKFALQQDNNSIWMLIDDSPVTWKAISGTASDPTDPESVEWVYYALKEILTSSSNITTTWNDGIFNVDLTGLSTSSVKTAAWTNIGVQIFTEQGSDPSSPAADHIALYVKDSGGVTRFYTKDSAGTVKLLGGGNAVDVIYDPTASGLVAVDVQAAIDEVAAIVALASLDVQEGTISIETGVNVLDFDSGDFTLSTPGTGEVHVALADLIMEQTIAFVIKDGAGIVASGIKLDWTWHHDCTIQQVDLLADQDTNAVIDIWSTIFASFPPTNADSITASAPPTLTAADSSSDSTLTGWSAGVIAGNVWRINLDSNSAATRLTLCVKFTRVVQM